MRKCRSASFPPTNGGNLDTIASPNSFRLSLTQSGRVPIWRQQQQQQQSAPQEKPIYKKKKEKCAVEHKPTKSVRLSRRKQGIAPENGLFNVMYVVHFFVKRFLY